MAQLPYHDEVHTALSVVGDMSTDSQAEIVKRLAPATKEGMAALKGAGVGTSRL